MNVGIAPPPEDIFNETQSFLSLVWFNYFSIIGNEINKNLSDLGYRYPAITTTISSKIAPDSVQTIVFDSTLQKMVLNNTLGFRPLVTENNLKTAEIITEAIKNPGLLYFDTQLKVLNYHDGTILKTVATV